MNTPLLTLSETWLAAPSVRWPLTVIYLLVIALVTVYGLHRYWLVLLYLRHRGNLPRIRSRFSDPPRVTVQLPAFNEPLVIARLIDACCRLDYPRDRLQIQVVDDSTDETRAIAAAAVARWRARGVNIDYLHRNDRTGFKAGALAAALQSATGDLIAIFDADFLPPANFLKRTVHHFTDPAVGCVQTRWDHINRDASLLTRAQAVFLDGHFLIEHAARHRAGRWFNFNGTAGVWRRAAIDAAGGWQHDTLTEDVDLSYRAQLAGWRFVYLPHVGCPAELPPQIRAFKTQQHRWAKGTIQTARKLLPAIISAPVAPAIKIEAVFHLTNPLVYPLITLMVLLFYPALRVNLTGLADGSMAWVIIGATLCALGTSSAAVFYILSQQRRKRPLWKTLLLIPALMSLGVGIAINNSKAVLEALLGHESPFVRTPKYNAAATAAKPAPPAARSHVTSTATAAADESSRARIKPFIGPMIELALAVYVLECLRMTLLSNIVSPAAPFLLLFALGYTYVGATTLWQIRQSRQHIPADATGAPHSI